MTIAFVWASLIISLMQCCKCKSRGKNAVDFGDGLTAGDETDGDKEGLRKERGHFRRDETIDQTDLEKS